MKFLKFRLNRIKRIENKLVKTKEKVYTDIIGILQTRSCSNTGLQTFDECVREPGIYHVYLYDGSTDRTVAIKNLVLVVTGKHGVLCYIDDGTDSVLEVDYALLCCALDKLQLLTLYKQSI